VLAHRALQPIGRITRVARRIQATDLSQRIELQGPEDELKELADTFDGMLGRLEAAWENQRVFIHEASHELRNPIAVIRTNVDVALADGEAPASELRESLQVVSRAADRMGVLVDDLLTYARREAPALRTTSVDLAEVVERTTAQFEAPAAARRLALGVEVQPGLVAQGDPVALEQALANLLANATRLAPEGSKVSVSAGRDGPWVWMAVTDEGPGIPADQQPKVFERFWRGDPAASRAEGRSGLGLTIVRQIARGHGGSVALQSAPGVGSTFSVWLPAQGPMEERGADGRADEAGDTVAGAGHGRQGSGPSPDVPAASAPRR
jgi:signal transduction histidine kinase